MELLTIQQVCRLSTLGRTKLWELSKKPDFPKPVRVTEGRKAFVKSEIEAWIAGLIEDRDRRV